MLSNMHKNALQYVKNTGECATKAHFIEDHEPVGENLWKDLEFADTVGINEQGKIVLLPAGESLLKEESHE